jgi:hypothetical protein
VASKSSYSGGEKGAEIEEQLDALDKLVDRLRVMYEQYFLGMAKQAPSYLHTDAERKVRDLTQLQIRNTALRYRFATITQKFGAYNTYWRRTLREIEQGRYVRDLSRIKRRAQQAGEEIPAEILAAMPRRMRDMVERDRSVAVARGKRRAGGDTGEITDTGDEAAAIIRDVGPQGAHRLDTSSHDDDLLDAIAREAEDAVDRALARLKPTTVPPFGAPSPPGAPPSLPGVLANPGGAPSSGAGRQGSSEPPARRTPSSSPPYAAPTAPARTTRLPTVAGVPPPPSSSRTTPPPMPAVPAGKRAGAPRREPSDTIPTPMEDIHPDLSPPPPSSRPRTEMGPPPPPPRPQRPRVDPPPGMSDADARALYAKFLKARQIVGESNDGMSYDKLVRTLRQQGARIMEQYQAKGVEFGVVIKDNKVVLKAKPKP